jgi:hypothetical protein
LALLIGPITVGGKTKDGASTLALSNPLVVLLEVLPEVHGIGVPAWMAS